MTQLKLIAREPTEKMIEAVYLCRYDAEFSGKEICKFVFDAAPHIETEAEKKARDKIVTPCPSCGRTTLFIGNGGHLTCSLLGCKQPSVERAIREHEAKVLEEAADRFEGYSLYQTVTELRRMAQERRNHGT